MNIIIGIINFIFFAVGQPDANGWVSVDPIPSVQESGADGDDPSIWVLFSKEWEGEKFLVRFPEDPHTALLADGSLEMDASKDGELYSLTVMPGTEESLGHIVQDRTAQEGILLSQEAHPEANVYDLAYQKGDKWVHEHFYLTPHHLYVFHTESTLSNADERHRDFCQSLLFP